MNAAISLLELADYMVGINLNLKAQVRKKSKCSFSVFRNDTKIAPNRRIACL